MAAAETIGFVTDASLNSVSSCIGVRASRSANRPRGDRRVRRRVHDDHADEALRVELAGQYRIDALGERGIGRRLP